MTARVRRRLADIAGGGGDVVAVPLQGSGTFAVEAALGTFVPRHGKLLILVNGAYGARMARIDSSCFAPFVAFSSISDASPSSLAASP